MPRHGARIVRGSRDRRAHERAVREHQGGSRGTPRPRPHLPDRAPGDEPGGRRLAAHDVPGARYAPAVLLRHVLPARAALRHAGIPRGARESRRFLQDAPRRPQGVRRQAGRRARAVAATHGFVGRGVIERTPADGACDAAARIRRQFRRLRRGPQVPASGQPRAAAAHLARFGRKRRARPAGALHGDADADAHGRRRPVRPAGRRLLPLFRRPVLDDSALREDAVRQRAAARRVRAGCRRHRRAAVPPRHRRNGRLAAARPALARGRLLLDAGCGFRRPRGQVLRLDTGRGARPARRRAVRAFRPALRPRPRRELRGPVAPAHVQVDRRHRDRPAARRGHGRNPHRRSAGAAARGAKCSASGRVATRRS